MNDAKTVIDFITAALAVDNEKALDYLANVANEELPRFRFIPNRIDDCVCCGLTCHLNEIGWCIDCVRSVQYKPTLDEETAKYLMEACVKAIKRRQAQKRRRGLTA